MHYHYDQKSHYWLNEAGQARNPDAMTCEARIAKTEIVLNGSLVIPANVVCHVDTDMAALRQLFAFVACGAIAARGQ